jgi:hypothetical protein
MVLRLYVQALATRDASELGAVARNIPPAHITGGLFRYSPDARAGEASATITFSPVHNAYAFATIKLADG